MRDMDLGDTASEKWNAINSINIRSCCKELLSRKIVFSELFEKTRPKYKLVHCEIQVCKSLVVT